MSRWGIEDIFQHSDGPLWVSCNTFQSYQHPRCIPVSAKWCPSWHVIFLLVYLNDILTFSKTNIYSSSRKCTAFLSSSPVPFRKKSFLLKQRKVTSIPLPLISWDSLLDRYNSHHILPRWVQWRMVHSHFLQTAPTAPMLHSWLQQNCCSFHQANLFEWSHVTVL